jgi:hypothetical protein
MNTRVLTSVTLFGLVARHWIGIFFSIVALAVVARHLMVMESGRRYWTIGDWLINYEGGLVRRGLLGSFTLSLADRTGINPAWLTGFMQALLYLAVVGLALHLFSRLRLSGPLLMLLFSPVFLLMPFYYMHMSMSKELFGFLALGLMALPAMNGQRDYFWAGAAVLAIGGLALEVNAFIAPLALGFVALYLWSGLFTRRDAMIAAATLLLPALAVLVFAIAFPGHGQSAAICQALVVRGISDSFCSAGGPIGWLERDTAFGIATMWKMTITPGNWRWYLVAYAAALAPFALFRVPGRAQTTWALYGLALIGILALAPLFVVATDWGRWIAVYVFALTLLAVSALRLGLIEPRVQSVGPLFLAYGFLWSMPEAGYTHTTYGMIGLAAKVAREAAAAAGF